MISNNNNNDNIFIFLPFHISLDLIYQHKSKFMFRRQKQGGYEEIHQILARITKYSQIIVPAKYPTFFCVMLVAAHNSTAFMYPKDASCPNISTYINRTTSSFSFFFAIPGRWIAFFK